jgi:hypothetical protein
VLRYKPARQVVRQGKVESPKALTNKNEMKSYICRLDRELQSVGADAQLANVNLQNMLRKQQQTLQIFSEISRKLHGTAMAVIRKFSG